MIPRREREPLLVWTLALALVLGLHYYWLWPYLGDTRDDFDAVHLYQPLARELLSAGASFFGNSRSLEAPPFSYGYHALLGASLPAVRWANFVLSGFTLCLLFRSGWLLHSRIAGLAAAFLFAASPVLKPFLAAPLTEAPFIFLNACWFWAMAEWLAGGRRAFVVVAGVALALAALTRATIFYWIVLLIAVFAWLSWRGRLDLRSRARGALVAHLIAISPPAAFIAKNVILFGFGFFATGAGNALYLGNHPVTGGYDPLYLGLIYDVGQVARDESQLTLRSERQLMSVARRMIRDEDPLFLARLHAQKLAAFLFVTKAETDALEWRCWRIGLMVLAAIGMVAISNAWLRWLLGGAILYQIAAYVPVLYTHRYSVGIDAWLALGAGVGVAALWARQRPREIAAAAAVALVAIGGGWYAYHRLDQPEPDVFRAARMRVWEGQPRRVQFDADDSRVEIPIRDAPLFHPWNANTLVFEAALSPGSDGKPCGPVRFAYQRAGETTVSAPIERTLKADGEVHRRQFGMDPIHLNVEGTLHLDIQCGKGGSLLIRRIALYTPMAGVAYARRYLGLPQPPLPIEE